MTLVNNDLKEAIESAESAARSKSEFLANMSHEIRTPLNGVLGILQLLQMTDLNDEQTKFVDTAVLSSKTLLTVIGDILDFSRVDAGKIEMHESHFDLKELTDSVENVFRAEKSKGEVDLNFIVDSCQEHLFSGDIDRIRQVLFNIISNSLKFTEKGSVTVRLWTVDEKIRNELKLFINVSDTGIGIPEEKISVIFDPFTQVDGSLTRKRQGSGLGLSIVKRLVELMGGEITVRSKVGEGTEVEIFLRVRRLSKSDQNIVDKIEISVDSPRLKILLAEDDKINQFIAVSLLTKIGHEAYAVNSGEEVIVALDKYNFDCLLMDIQMPVIDGIQVTKMIRFSGKPYSNIPIIAVTAHAMKGDREIFLSAGMDDYVAKPIDLRALKKAIESTVLKRKKLDNQ